MYGWKIMATVKAGRNYHGIGVYVTVHPAVKQKANEVIRMLLEDFPGIPPDIRYVVAADPAASRWHWWHDWFYQYPATFWGAPDYDDGKLPSEGWALPYKHVEPSVAIVADEVGVVVKQ